MSLQIVRQLLVLIPAACFNCRVEITRVYSVPAYLALPKKRALVTIKWVFSDVDPDMFGLDFLRSDRSKVEIARVERVKLPDEGLAVHVEADNVAAIDVHCMDTGLERHHLGSRGNRSRTPQRRVDACIPFMRKCGDRADRSEGENGSDMFGDEVHDRFLYVIGKSSVCEVDGAIVENCLQRQHDPNITFTLQAALSMTSSAVSTRSQQQLIEQWKADPGGTYRSWFLWEERIKNFRSIRRGLQAVVKEIRDSTFGNVYRGSSLETVVHSIAEQRQIFKGADHAFLWKPKLRIPDIYENREHQLAFGRFLDTCLCCSTGSNVVEAVRTLDAQQIKGLGPACANLLYFLHPTVTPPNNTAIVKGFNMLFGANVKLGRWNEYLAMRARLIEFNATHRHLLSNDLGAVGGLMFDIGSGRYGQLTSDLAVIDWQADVARAYEESAAANKARLAAAENDNSHTEVQGWLRDLGLALGYRVWVANNDKSRPYGAGKLADGCLTELPTAIRASSAYDTIALIDILWLDAVSGRIAMAFEVEHSTSIYSGIVRMLDLALGVPDHAGSTFFLVAPDARETDVRAQFARPAFSRVSELDVRYIGYSDLARHRDAIARFGNGEKAMLALSKRLTA